MEAATDRLDGNRKFIPYEERKHHIEAKGQNELAKNSYTLKQGTPESRETRNKQALQATAPEPQSVPAPQQESKTLISMMKCTYCLYDNDDTVDCYILQRHLQNGQAKGRNGASSKFQAEAFVESTPTAPLQGSFSGKSRNQHHNDVKSNWKNNSGKPQKPQ
ncbi:hypothetical protein PC116_g11338 [Phytophthora cactorum]|uniref:Uncharacterized protein n=1 Tax=Phytophthora cactorum TaxID=29920 RepID=A0A329SNF0_9STRA|nr:hypothetical protein Pcac1_g54 [Phytophthora cactorum]KAG2847939.1 hypothetical protein PC113_g17670 [Phytophthora cactorum]KAG2882926.1 hypothetical protein PC114_g20793 [Phytophthora cactorum]KAG2919636.1 hypothetical protein PC115_g10067 [Phytophthora cactorum]KAG2933033.1 hypothetical protein PC117_g12963 [Phytophthora cactorum]